MSRLFWLLMAAVQHGSRYLRAVLRASSGLSAKGKTAPGASASAEAEMLMARLQGKGVSRPGAEGRFPAQAEGAGLLAHMVAWLVAIGVFPGRTETDLVIDIEAAPAADMRRPLRAVLDSVRRIEACPGIPMALRRRMFDQLTAEPEMAPPDEMSASMDATAQALDGVCAMAGPSQTSAVMRNRAVLSAEPGTSFSGSTMYPAYSDGPELTARIMVWIPHQWVKEQTLYIRQTYETKWDGDTLILN